jgi:hypothetical protein
LMERSSKFISLSGLSGVLAGIYALIGAYIAHGLLNQAPAYHLSFGGDIYNGPKDNTIAVLAPLIFIALAVLIASILTGVVLSYRKAQKNNQLFWSKTSRELLFNMIVPLIAGGLLMIIFIARGYYGIVAPASLIFYGLALVGAGNFTFSAIRSLGICEIILGLIAALYPGYGLYFWAIGFGVLHIIYGSVMYLKYDK